MLAAIKLVHRFEKSLAFIIYSQVFLFKSLMDTGSLKPGK